MPPQGTSEIQCSRGIVVYTMPCLPCLHGTALPASNFSIYIYKNKYRCRYRYSSYKPIAIVWCLLLSFSDIQRDKISKAEPNYPTAYKALQKISGYLNEQ